MKSLLLLFMLSLAVVAAPPPDDFGLELVRVVYIPSRTPGGVGKLENSYAIFRCKSVMPDGRHIPDFAKRPGDTFTLPAGSGKTYKVLSIEKQQAVVEYPNGSKKTLKLAR